MPGLRGIWSAIVRGPIVHDENGNVRALARPTALEFVLALLVTAAAMIALYSGLDGRNRAMLASGRAFFSPSTRIDEALGFVPIFVFAYYSYFVLLFFFSVLTIRDRRIMYEGVVGYLGIAAIGFLFFWLVPSRMVQPDLSGCDALPCRMLEPMYRLDDGFNIFPSLHVGYSTLVWLFFRRYMPEVARPILAVLFAIALSTLFCKRHYFVDLPVAVAMGVSVHLVALATGHRLAKALRFLGPRGAGA